MHNPNLNRLVDALLEGDQERAVAEAMSLRNGGVEDERIIADAIEPAMGRLDAKCTVEQFNLLEIMLVGRAVTGGHQGAVSRLASCGHPGNRGAGEPRG
jgi:dimethylamine corrinoid protein